MADLAKLVVSLEAETAKYRKELEKANRQLDKFGRDQKNTLGKIDRGFATLARSVKAGFVSAIAAAAGALSIGLVQNLAKAGARLNDFSTRIGVSAQELQAWEQIASESGISANQFDLALQRVTRRAAEAAQGFGEAKGALKELGIDARRFSALSLDNKVLDLARALEGAGSEADQLRLAFKLFDSEGTAVLQFLKEGEEGLKKLREKMTGQVWSDETLQKLREADQALTGLGNKFTIMAGNVAAFLLDAGSSFLDWLTGVKEKAEGAAQAVDRIARSGRNARNANAGTGTPGSVIGDLFGIEPGGAAGTSARRRTGAGVRNRTGTTAETPAPRDTSLGGAKDPFDFGIPEINNKREAEKSFEDFLEYQRQRTVENEAILSKISVDEHKKTAEAEKEFLDGLQKEIEDFRQRSRDQAEAFGELFVDNLVRAGEGGFDTLLQQWARTLQQMLAKAVATKLFEALFPQGIGGTAGGGFGGVIQNLFGRANGGAVAAGTPYMVGERGPEMFIPATSGRIQPSAGGVNINQSLTVNGASRAEFLAAAGALKEQTKAEVMDMLRRRR